MSDTINKALMDTWTGYELEDSKIKVATLAFYALSKGLSSISNEWMTKEQIAELRNHAETRENAWTWESMELFRRNAPQTRIIEIPNGHHYCFIGQEELVYEEMWMFYWSDEKPERSICRIQAGFRSTRLPLTGTTETSEPPKIQKQEKQPDRNFATVS